MRNKWNQLSAPLSRNALRLILIVVLAFLATAGLHYVQYILDGAQSGGAQIAATGILVVGLIIYAVLMAIPFVPGVEVGLTLLMMQGARIAPFVFIATFSGLTIAYLVGRYLPLAALRSIFADIGLKAVCRLLDRMEQMDRDQRLDVLREKLPLLLRGPLVRYRYFCVALALNIPGNAFVCGGGGIALVAGLSGLFRTPLILITFALAVSPVPILVMVFDLQVFTWWK